jgi:hypothetical protein
MLSMINLNSVDGQLVDDKQWKTIENKRWISLAGNPCLAEMEIGFHVMWCDVMWSYNTYKYQIKEIHINQQKLPKNYWYMTAIACNRFWSVLTGFDRFWSKTLKKIWYGDGVVELSRSILCPRGKQSHGSLLNLILITILSNSRIDSLFSIWVL